MRESCAVCAVRCRVRTEGGFLTLGAAYGRKAMLNTWRDFDVWPANVRTGDRWFAAGRVRRKLARSVAITLS